MTMTVRYDPRGDRWLFGGEQRRSDGADSLVIKRVDLQVSTATDLARALREARRRELEPDSVIIDLAPDDEYSPKESVVDDVHFYLLPDGRLAVNVGLSSEVYMDSDEDFAAVVAPLVSPLLARISAQLHSASCDGHRSTAPYFHSATITVNTRGKTLQDLYDIAKQVQDLYEAATGGELRPDTMVDLILGGRAELLIGQREGPWLDVKSQHYDLQTPHGKIALSQAVARFCNAETGGLVVFGMDTKRVPGGEIIRSIKPVPVDSATPRRYRQAIESSLFPFPDGLRVETVELAAGTGIVITYVPRQEEELKPFLVHGAIVGDQVEGAFISIVRRSGEDSIPITAQQIHSTLAAGRALLRRGRLAEDG